MPEPFALEVYGPPVGHHDIRKIITATCLKEENTHLGIFGESAGNH
jgi:hypothetical protein